MLDKPGDVAYMSLSMDQKDSKDSKDFEEGVAKAMVSAVLTASPRVDTFSTWLMGITTGFLVILFTNIERTISVIKIGPAKALIVSLILSTVIGLFQKYLALQLHIQTDVQDARDRKMVEAVKIHSGSDVADAYRYFREHADVVHMLVLFTSAFPMWMQRRIHKMIASKPEPLLSGLQKDTKKLIWQFVAVIWQLSGALATVLIILFSL